MNDIAKFRKFNVVVLFVLGLVIPVGCVAFGGILNSEGLGQSRTFIVLLSLGCAGLQFVAWIIGEIIYVIWRRWKS